MAQIHKLSARQTISICEPGRYGDGGGLWLQVSNVGNRITKSWLYRFTMLGRAREMGLGSFDSVSLVEARKLSAAARLQVAAGIDPIELRREASAAAKIQSARGITFKECAERYISAHEQSWKNEKHKAQWRSTMELYAYPIVGSLPVSLVDTALVMKIIEPLWNEKTETATRVRGRIEVILDWATVREFRRGENPARWKGHLSMLLPAPAKTRRVKHHSALPFNEIAVFICELQGIEGISPRALEFTILNASRTSEVIGAKWTEFDFAAKVWTIPGERMKSSREHRIPLSDRSLDILAGLAREGEYTFPGASAGSPLSNMAMLELVKQHRPGITVHGFRSTFKDWASEMTNYPNQVSEMALAHMIDDKTEAAYRRGDLFEKRRRLLRDWAKYCATPMRTNEKVIGIRAAL